MSKHASNEEASDEAHLLQFPEHCPDPEGLDSYEFCRHVRAVIRDGKPVLQALYLIRGATYDDPEAPGYEWIGLDEIQRRTQLVDKQCREAA
jgi:hypothetical protein